MIFPVSRKIASSFLVLVTLVCAIAELVAFPAQWIRPSGISVSALLSMVEPFIILANFLLLLVWTIMWKRWVLIPLFICCLSFGHIGSYFYPRFVRDYGITQEDKKQLKVVTYNVKDFKNSLPEMDSALTIIAGYQPDIVSIAEFTSMGESGKALIEEKLSRLKYHVSNKGIDENIVSEFGILIFSRFPLRHPAKYEYKGMGTSVMADAIIDYGDTLRLVALHMCSTRYNEISKEKSIELYMVDSIEGSLNTDENREIIKNRTDVLISTISESSNLRSYQADTVRQIIEKSPYKTIVLGDFNDTPYSYTVRTIMGDTHADSFREVARNQYGYTFNLLHKLFRIDYVLPEDEYYKVVDYKTLDSDVSDHNPVMVTLIPRP